MTKQRQAPNKEVMDMLRVIMDHFNNTDIAKETLLNIEPLLFQVEYLDGVIEKHEGVDGLRELYNTIKE